MEESHVTAEEHTQARPEVQAYVRRLIDQAADVRLPELFTHARRDAIYRSPNRHGVSVVFLRTHQLGEEQLIKLMQYRLAQYLATNFVDHEMVYANQMEHEPLANVRPNDIHGVAGDVQTGEILCYGVIKGVTDVLPGATLRVRDRPLFPAERNHGWGIFNRLKLLPDLPIAKIFELGRFVKNQRRHVLDELGVRAPIEGGCAVLRALTGPLALEVDAVIGDLEEGVGGQTLQFFHIPTVVIHGTVPYEAERDYFFPRYRQTTVYPFAFLVSDLSAARSRIEVIERALELPGKQGLSALFRLKRDLRTTRSSLEPDEGLAPLATTRLPQKQVAMPARRAILDAADRLRGTDLLGSLSVAEAAILGTLMEPYEVEAGTVIIHQGEPGDALFIIQAGEAEVRVRTATGEVLPMARFGPGEYFGEIALLTGGERTADVVAVTPMTLLRLSEETYTRYLASAAEVQQHVARTAAVRGMRTVRRLTEGKP